MICMCIYVIDTVSHSLEAFETILYCAYSTMVWTYGDMEMRTHSLYQIDTFRVKDKKLHAKDGYASALEIVVSREVPVLTALPVFETLIHDKWKKFARRHHIRFAVIPYALFVTALTSSTLNRTARVREARLSGVAPPDEEGERWGMQIEIALDMCAFGLSVPYLVWIAYLHSRVRWHFLDVNEDKKVSWHEFTLYIFKNLLSILCMLIAVLLVTIAAIRFLSQPMWHEVSRESLSPGTREHILLKQELDLLAVTAVLAWCNVLMMALPFRGVGLLLISMARMLSNSVLKWLFIYLLIVTAFSLGAMVLMELSPNAMQDGEAPTTWADMMKLFVWVSVGEVTPGSLLHEARSPALMTLLFFCFLVTATWMLMNLLISLMNSTFAKDIEKGKQTWWLEFASLVLRYETFLSDAQKKRYRSGMFVERNLDPAKQDHDHSDVEFYLVKVKSRGEESRKRPEWMHELVSTMAQAFGPTHFKVRVCARLCACTCAFMSRSTAFACSHTIYCPSYGSSYRFLTYVHAIRIL